MPKQEKQRLSINLPASVLDELRALADSSHRSMTELIRDAFALAKIAHEERQKGNKLTVTDASGKLIKELIMPN